MRSKKNKRKVNKRNAAKRMITNPLPAPVSGKGDTVKINCPFSMSNEKSNPELDQWFKHAEHVLEQISYEKMDGTWILTKQWRPMGLFDFSDRGDKGYAYVNYRVATVNQEPQADVIIDGELVHRANENGNVVRVRDWNKGMPLNGQRVKIKHFSSDEVIIRAVYDTVEEMENHERDEWFKVNGQRVFNPHADEFKRCNNDVERRYVRENVWQLHESVLGEQKNAA